jgi:glucosylceramidase
MTVFHELSRAKGPWGQTKDITRSGLFWAFDHFSRLIHRGARRFNSHSTANDIQHVAFENRGGRQVLVVANKGAAREIELRLGNTAALVALTEKSLTTLAWQ